MGITREDLREVLKDFATKEDVARLERHMDQRLATIQWTMIVFLGFNAAMLSAFLWAVAVKLL